MSHAVSGPDLWRIAGLSLLVNALLFTGLPNLLVTDAPTLDLEFIQSVDFLREPPRRETPPRPQAPEPPPEAPRVIPQKTIRAMHTPTPVQPRMEIPRFDLSTHPDMTLGVPVAAPEPPAPASSAAPVLKSNYGMQEVDQVPVATLKTRPAYPYRARRLSIDGEVDVKFLVDVAGRVSRIAILRADPPGLFDDAVLQTLPDWRFAPGSVAGKPVNTWVTTTIVFRIDAQ